MRDAGIPIPILGLESVDDLDSKFRPGGGYIARGPFRVYSPDWDHWEFGYDLEQVGPNLIFQDGSGVGRPISVDDYSRSVADTGSVIWFNGYDGDQLSTFMLTTAQEHDFRAYVGKSVMITSWEDGARAVRHMLETQRWKTFGITRDEPLVTRHGLVCWVDDVLPVVGLFAVERGTLIRLVEDRWQAVDERVQPWNVPGAPEAVWFPVLDGGVKRYAQLADCDSLTINTAQLGRYVFPRVMLKSPSTWVEQINRRVESSS